MGTLLLIPESSSSQASVVCQLLSLALLFMTLKVSRHEPWTFEQK